MCESVSVTSTKRILLDSSNGFGIDLEHDFLVGTKPATQATEVHKHHALGHISNVAGLRLREVSPVNQPVLP
jgi:hypothetical protein